eukprot:TRINITY_DN23569_c0_g1_i2.p2 TRINITY_DN23569_c0_g1~~TRINITY_DN23569_c0_g1_i2.p2  ORF type:complete len:294 (+),score=86.73 TRINITY_DN23569_c0_g1_i2:93-974(+)
MLRAQTYSGRPSYKATGARKDVMDFIYLNQLDDSATARLLETAPEDAAAIVKKLGRIKGRNPSSIVMSSITRMSQTWEHKRVSKFVTKYKLGADVASMLQGLPPGEADKIMKRKEPVLRNASNPKQVFADVMQKSTSSRAHTAQMQGAPTAGSRFFNALALPRPSGGKVIPRSSQWEFAHPQRGAECAAAQGGSDVPPPLLEDDSGFPNPRDVPQWLEGVQDGAVGADCGSVSWERGSCKGAGQRSGHGSPAPLAEGPAEAWPRGYPALPGQLRPSSGHLHYDEALLSGDPGR